MSVKELFTLFSRATLFYLLQINKIASFEKILNLSMNVIWSEDNFMLVNQ